MMTRIRPFFSSHGDRGTWETILAMQRETHLLNNLLRFCYLIFTLYMLSLRLCQTCLDR
jgi:hypothetical protein